MLNVEERQLKVKLYKKYREEALPNKNLIEKLKDKDFIIITSRRAKWQEMTQSWVFKYNLKPSAILFYDQKEKTREKIIEYKARILNSLNVEIYYEDDKIILEGLKKLCPKTKILSPNNL